ncbi:TPA: hypothetical protein ACH3X2_005178 [Trebouxia sp. C0005]
MGSTQFVRIDLHDKGSGDLAPPASPMAEDKSVLHHGTHIFSWGRGDLGQLGTERDQSEPQPVLVRAVEDKDIAHVAASAFNSAFITADAELWTTGSNDSCQLGHKGHDTQLHPSRVEALDAHGVCQVACGQQHMLAVADGGALCAWGAADSGQLGLGEIGVEQPHPRFLKGTKEQHFVRVAAGASHSLALTSSGQVWSFGQGSFGTLGQGDSFVANVPRPLPTLAALGIVQVACGESHNAALTIHGRVFTWGRGKYGALGLGTFNSSSWPQHVAALQEPACQVVCGGEHTMAICQQGKVFSWGRGNCGQTGLGTTDTVTLPARLEALENHSVTQITAGLRHSMALTDSRQLWVWGDNSEGQLGIPIPSPCLDPVQTHAFPAEATIMYIVAGGEHSLAAVQNAGDVADEAQHVWSECRGHSMAAMPGPSLAAGLAEQNDYPRKVSILKKSAHDLFSCPGFMLHTFETQPCIDSATTSIEDPPTSSGSHHPAHGLDVGKITEVYNALLQVYSIELLGVVCQACKRQLDIIHSALCPDECQQNGLESHAQQQRIPRMVEPYQLIRALFVLLQNPLNGDRTGMRVQLMGKLAFVTARIEQANKACLAAWLRELPLDQFASRCVRPVQYYLGSLARRQGSKQDREDLMRAVHLLHIMYQSNEGRSTRLPHSEFYNKDVSQSADLAQEYMIWRHLLEHRNGTSSPGRGGGPGQRELVTLCQLPFVLSPEAKARIMQGEALLTKQHQVQASAIQALFQGVHPVMVQYLDVRIRRTHVLQDAMNQLMHRPGELKKPLRVTFISGGMDEEGLDEGGVTKEFFQLLIRQIFNEEFGMFKYMEHTRTFWFSHLSIELETEYRLVGSVLGLAIYNGVILDLHFPPVVYKKLLNGKPNFQDLKKAMPDLGHGLQQLLDYPGDVEADLATTFSVEEDNFGELQTHELKPDGSKIAVTNSNRQEYVDLHTKWVLEDSIQTQFAAFDEGFHQVCGGLTLRLFQYEELELLVCGLPHLDFAELKEAAQYDGGYHPQHPVIVQFWQVVMALTFEQKKSFLRFCTGCDRAPVEGLSGLKLTIQRGSPDTDRLPTTHVKAK